MVSIGMKLIIYIATFDFVPKLQRYFHLHNNKKPINSFIPVNQAFKKTSYSIFFNILLPN